MVVVTVGNRSNVVLLCDDLDSEGVRCTFLSSHARGQKIVRVVDLIEIPFRLDKDATNLRRMSIRVGKNSQFLALEIATKSGDEESGTQVPRRDRS